MLTTTLLALTLSTALIAPLEAGLFVQGAPLKKTTRDNPPAPTEESASTAETPVKADLKPADGKCCSKGKPEPWDGYNKGVVWGDNEKYTWEAAKVERKVVLYFQLVGDLDKEGC